MEEVIYVTTHSKLRENAKKQLEKLQHDHQKQSAWLANAESNLATVRKTLDEFEQKRQELLERLRTLHSKLDKSEAMRDLAKNTPLEQKLQQEYEAAQAELNALHRTIAALAEPYEANREMLHTCEEDLEKTREALGRIESRLAVAQTAYAEIDAKHCQELKEQQLAQLAATDAEILATEAALDQLRRLRQDEQREVVEVLAEWPSEARTFLLEHGEFVEDERTHLLQTTLDYLCLLESAADSGVLRELGHILKIDVPAELSIVGSRAWQRKKNDQRIDHKGVSDAAKGWGLHPSFWPYEQALLRAEKHLEQH